MPMANLGKYEIHEQLGAGSMGIVYRARDTVLHRDVALKTIRTGADIEPEMRERFYREARSCGRLQHPNIVTIYDLGEQDRTAYIAMELLEGSDFRNVIAERSVESLPNKLELMIQICEALGHAHRHGVIHRDIKPSNIFLAGASCVKVLDFGIARLPSSQLTVAGNVLGTPNYMAPEQILAKPCDGRADLFSAGVVFFEFLTGQHPFRGSLIPQRIVESAPDSLFDHQSDLPVLLEKVFARALAKPPEQRYATGAAFAADLRTILDGLRQNSSPTFSRMTLPSERAAPELDSSLAAKSRVEPAKAPDGEDSGEWRYSQVLATIPLFESALERNDGSEARKHYDALERVTAGDERFSEAVTGCRIRLDKISPPLEPGAGAKPTSPRICAQCGTGNRSAARFCIQCGADLDDEEEQAAAAESAARELESDRQPLNPTILNTGFETSFSRTVIQPKEEFAKPPIVVPDVQPVEPAKVPATFFGRVNNWVQAHPRQAVADVVAVALLVIVGFVLRAISGAGNPEAHAVAMARANRAKVDVFETASPNSRRLYSLSNGSSVRVLEMPSSHSEPWVHVQAVFDGKPQRPGFAQQNELANWKGLDAAAAFAICCNFEGAAATDKDIESRRSTLDDFAVLYPGTAESIRALTERARLRLDLIKAHQAQGSSGTALSAELDAAIDEANKAGDSAIPVKEELVKIKASVPPEVEKAAEAPPPLDLNSPAVLLWRAEKHFDEGDYRRAKQNVLQVLQTQPDDAKAKKLMAKIEKAIALENQ